jgi:MerR family redox-sensitive transcriptional activator SoxR
LLLTNTGEAMFAASVCEGAGLFIGPAVAGVAPRPFSNSSLHGHQATTGEEYSAHIPETGVDVRPVVHGGDRPYDRSGPLGKGDRLGGTFQVSDPRTNGKEVRTPQHHGRRIDSRRRRTQSGCVADRDSWTAPDVHDPVPGSQAAQSCRKPRVALPAEGHAERGHQSGDACKTGIVGVAIGGRVLFHPVTLTVEADFKSSGQVPEPLLTIGEVAERAHTATSTIRYYERLGLLAADARTSGQRRFREATLRRLVFIGMLRDAGLALADIAGILDAADATEWKAIAARRLEILDSQIDTLHRARGYLAGALLCRYDHPATDCKIMGAEIDRRLGDVGETG